MFDDLTVNLVSGELNINKPARIQISMFNPFCTGKYLIALSDWVNRKGFGNIEYQIADTLQRYNYVWRNNLPIVKARALSIQSGERWLALNSSGIQLCFQNFQKFSITRWDFWIQHKEFSAVKNFFNELLISDSGFRNSINEEIELYFKRLGRSLDEERKKLSQDFLIEEIAVSEISEKYYPANEIYPGKELIPERYLVENKPDLYISRSKLVHVDIIDRNNDGE